MDELLDFISKDLREYMERKNMEFSHRDKATLIYNSGLSVQERERRLEIIAAETEDAELRAQIRDRLKVEREDMEAYLEVSAGNVYVVSVREESDTYAVGYFANHNLAYDFALRQGVCFQIEKYPIASDDSQMEAEKGKVYVNPYIGEDTPIEDCVREYDNYDEPVAVVEYDEKGILTALRSREIQRDDAAELERMFSSARFENAFMYMEQPFERGDFVCLVGDKGSHGLVATSQAEWREFLAAVKAGKFKGADFIDSSITVDFVDEENHCIYHNHINPAFLERYEPDKQAQDYFVLRAGSYLLQGKTDLDEFLSVYEDYKGKAGLKAD